MISAEPSDYGIVKYFNKQYFNKHIQYKYYSTSMCKGYVWFRCVCLSSYSLFVVMVTNCFAHPFLVLFVFYCVFKPSV